jgi:hypothetical protein
LYQHIQYGVLRLVDFQIEVASIVHHEYGWVQEHADFEKDLLQQVGLEERCSSSDDHKVREGVASGLMFAAKRVGKSNGSDFETQEGGWRYPFRMTTQGTWKCVAMILAVSWLLLRYLSEGGSVGLKSEGHKTMEGTPLGPMFAEPMVGKENGREFENQDVG